MEKWEVRERNGEVYVHRVEDSIASDPIAKMTAETLELCQQQAQQIVREHNAAEQIELVLDAAETVLASAAAYLHAARCYRQRGF